jgi:uncharacterized protein (TIGR02246 family)
VAEAKKPTAKKRAVDDRARAKRLIRRLVSAWNGGDAAGFARLFSRSGEYVTGSGARVVGPEEIAGLVRGRAEESQVAVVGPIDVQLTGPGGSVRFRWRSNDRGGRHRQGIITCAIARTGQGWRIERLSNDEAQRPGQPNRRMTRDRSGLR